VDGLAGKLGGEGLRFRQINVGNDNFGAGVGENAAGGFADPAGAAGDDGPPPRSAPA